MLKKILSISGRPGLFRLVAQGKNSLIVENIATKARTAVHSRDKVISLGDIAMYTTDGDIPMVDVLESLKEKTNAQSVDLKAFNGDSEVRKYFATILPNFDDDRIYTTDMRKLFSWYNQLIAAGITQFKDEETPAQDTPAE